VQLDFQAHIDLLQLFLARREEIVEKIQALLNGQRKPAQYLADRSLLARRFEDCFFALGAIDDGRSGLRGQLEDAHWASGFRPRQMPQLFNDLVHPAEMMIRGVHCWQQTRWPGRNGRVRYAHTLFNLYLLRCHELLSMRLWDAGADQAGARLAQVQRVLDELWRGTPTDQPVLVRDARWLITLAQSPTTDELGGYFEVARKVAESLTQADRLEVQKASVLMIGGHLRSQIRHYCMKDGLSLDDDSVIRRTRSSNALDFALLIQGLVPLLDAYERARLEDDEQARIELASVILQGISADPEMFLNRIDLLAAYSMIEHLFIAIDGNGDAVYTPIGRRHVRLLEAYECRIGVSLESLYEDCPRFRPADGTYSPYGAIYGTASNLTEIMALKTLQPDAEIRYGLEDVFVDGDTDKVAWVDAWRKLPHIDPEVQKLYEYPDAFAREIFERIERALTRAVSRDESEEASRPGRLMLLREADQQTDPEASRIPDLPVRYIASSDPQMVAAGKASPCDEASLLRERQEGHFAVSFETAGGWAAVRKDMLTEVLGAGQVVKIVGLPAEAEGVLRLMCGNLAAAEGVPPQASMPPSMVKA